LIRIVSKNRLIRHYAHGHTPSGERSPYYKGGWTIDGHGYRLVRYKGHPNANKKGWIKEHRLVMSQFLGRPLESWEHIHHIDGNKLNNDISNLQLVTDSHHGTISNENNRKYGQRCSDPKCKHPDRTEMRKYKNGLSYPKWFNDGNGGNLCSTCYKRRLYALKHPKKLKKEITSSF
jgi:hypothetical protein